MKAILFSLLSALLLTTTLATTGCNTTKGLGQDVEAAGKGIKNEAEEKKGY